MTLFFKKWLPRTFLQIALVCWLTGCSSMVPLTPDLLKEYKLSNYEVGKLQLFVSDGILLEAERTLIDKEIDSTHSLKTVEDNFVKQIYFKKKTPCIPMEAKADRLYVAFETGDYLLFKLNKKHPQGKVFSYVPDRKSKGEKINRISGSGFSSWTFVGRETYKDSVFNVLVKTEGVMPYLLVDEESLKNLVIEKRSVPGLRQGQ